ncbi:MAG TPA: RNA polymerase sigma factor [Nocardioidaceae bacterium]|nr:RNA polymerase sigma factor [Nocardioidaceae bacterium]
MEASFAEALAAARAGDEDGFVAVFRSVQPTLLRFLRTLGHDLAEDAQDIAAETWVRVTRDLAKFSGDEHGFRAWVFTIARARLVDARRAAARRPVSVDADAEFADRADPVDVVGCVEELISTEAALATIGRLPRDQAEAVLLRYVVGLDAAHAATVTGKTAGAVRVCAHRGLRRLSELVEQRDGATGCNAHAPADGTRGERTGKDAR